MHPGARPQPDARERHNGTETARRPRLLPERDSARLCASSSRRRHLGFGLYVTFLTPPAPLFVHCRSGQIPTTMAGEV
eukprot:2964451-Prymnesium_polylepis.1